MSTDAGQTQTTRKWDDVNDDNRRWQMTMPVTVRHSQVVTTRGTERSLHESVACHKTDQISSSHHCSYVARWRSHQCGTWSVSRGSEDASLGSREQSAGTAGSRVASWRRIQTVTEATRPPDDHLSWGHHERRAGTASRCAPRNSKLCRCPSSGSSYTPQSKQHQKGLGSRGWRRTCGDIVWVDSTPGRLGNDVLAGNSEARRHAEFVDTEGFQVRPVRHDTREPSRFDDETAAETEDRATHEPHWDTSLWRSERMC